MVELPFQDREEAGRLLGAELARRGLASDTVVLALARGGVPIGAKVAEALKSPFDAIVVRKIGVPWQPELAMGAIAGSARLLDHRLIRDFHIAEKDVDAVVAAQMREKDRQEKLYHSAFPAPELSGRTVVLVDDGLATGSTMAAAIHHVRNAHPKRVIVAVPVGASQSCKWMAREADECVCLAVPEKFSAVGEWYRDFPQVTDAEVLDCLNVNRRAVPSTSSV